MRQRVQHDGAPVPDELNAHALWLLRDGNTMWLETDYECWVPIYNESELALAARLVVDHANRLRGFDDDGWIADTCRIWENNVFSEFDVAGS